MREFSDPHLAALAALAALIAVSVWLPRRRGARARRAYARTLAAVILAAWAGEYLADALNGSWSVRNTLPLQLTDAISVSAALALLTRRQLLVELTWYWSLTATLQAVLTPDLAQSFPSIYYFTYFGYHEGAIAAACFLVAGCRLRPRRGGSLRVFAITLGWAAIAGAADALTAGNYMYLRFKPAHASLLSFLGPWPWYIAAAGALGLAMLVILEVLTGLLTDRRSRPAPPPAFARAQRRFHR